MLIETPKIPNLPGLILIRVRFLYQKICSGYNKNFGSQKGFNKGFLSKYLRN